MTTTDRPADVAVTMLPASEAENARLVARLVALVNEVYRHAEKGLWQDGPTRTTPDELTDLIGAQQIALATREGQVVGSVQVSDIADDVSMFGMLVADPAHRGIGVGNALVEFAEGRARDAGRRAMQLELIVPRSWTHPHKEFLASWYGRLGYRAIGSTAIGRTHPQLAPLLATPCDLKIYEKPLR
ncbi:MAG TPA: GNAT family N-acetyltransferase [Jatrophihabitans sp.]|jgi:GNAT superfamily N-acetyltransferase|nr:GNAT family N-acetyltransferase [Jatrophihabitans sp.]